MAKRWQNTLYGGVLLLGACTDELGRGTADFTTWGEEYIEEGIPEDPSGEGGFVDGWTLHYDKFLVVFHGIKVADRDGEVAAEMRGSLLVDNAQPGVKKLVSFPNLRAKRWDRVSYQIRPADANTQLLGASEADRDMMVESGYSVYVEGYAEKQLGQETLTKTFHWGFSSATQYGACQHAAQSGQALEGIVITSGGTDVSELTTHGDHLFYDRLMSSDDPAIKTSLRFEEKAAADADQDGEITMAELDRMRIDVRLYDPSGFEAPTLGAFIRSLVRTVGHFRGEGECTVSAL